MNNIVGNYLAKSIYIRLQSYRGHHELVDQYGILEHKLVNCIITQYSCYWYQKVFLRFNFLLVFLVDFEFRSSYLCFCCVPPVELWWLSPLFTPAILSTNNTGSLYLTEVLLKWDTKQKQKTKHHTVGTVSNSNRKIIETEV